MNQLVPGGGKGLTLKTTEDTSDPIAEVKAETRAREAKAHLLTEIRTAACVATDDADGSGPPDDASGPGSGGAGRGGPRGPDSYGGPGEAGGRGRPVDDGSGGGPDSGDGSPPDRAPSPSSSDISAYSDDPAFQARVKHAKRLKAERCAKEKTQSHSQMAGQMGGPAGGMSGGAGGVGGMGSAGVWSLFFDGTVERKLCELPATVHDHGKHVPGE